MNRESGGSAALRNTFVHVAGIGYSTERYLWREGVQTWDDFREMKDSVGIRPSQREALVAGLGESEKRLARQDQAYFATSLPSREYWRAYSDFKPDTAFLDIETTGLEVDGTAVTVIGLYDGRRMKSFVKGDNFGDFPHAFRKHKVIVTFNGARFDLPFIRAAFPDLSLDQIHIDLRYPLRRLGFVGGLKAIERRLGIARSEDTKDLSGWDAVRLWRAYEQGDEGALETLLRYNAEDVKNLEALMDLAYCTLRTIYLRHGFTSGDEWREDIRIGLP